MRIFRMAVVVLGAIVLAAPVIGQDVELKSESDGNLTALLEARRALQTYGLSVDPLSATLSPDSAALLALGDAASSGEDYLRAVADLLGVYDNIQCASDRAMMKPLLEDRLRLYSHLLDLSAQRASVPFTTPGAVKLQATTQRALKIRDDLRAAKSKIDAAAHALQ